MRAERARPGGRRIAVARYPADSPCRPRAHRRAEHPGRADPMVRRWPACISQRYWLALLLTIATGVRSKAQAAKQFHPPTGHGRLTNPSVDRGRSSAKKRPQITHHHQIPPRVTIIRKGHAFDGQSLAAISSLFRRGILFVLVSLPDGSRSLIPARWTDWDGCADPLSSDHDLAAGYLARLHDLLHLRKVLHALQSQLDQGVLPMERHDATDTWAFQSSQSAAGDLNARSPINRLGRHRRDLAPDSAGGSRAPHRRDAGRRAGEGGEQ